MSVHEDRRRLAATFDRAGELYHRAGAGHVIPRDGDPFFEELQEVYDEIGESLPPGACVATGAASSTSPGAPPTDRRHRSGPAEGVGCHGDSK